ncbi:unnamed protein product [Hymenolepis diminuta]|uniref:Uncharacterized protein n=1 Tax=Hymenolepis diminuta TaxID=6216 RepID=A0A564YXS1_HYMDI|nr:unnamed protein product [Hymenolepis diminuta]
MLFYISSFEFCHPFNSSSQAINRKLSSDRMVFMDVLHRPGYCSYQREGFGVMWMLIIFLRPSNPSFERRAGWRGILLEDKETSSIGYAVYLECPK